MYKSVMVPVDLEHTEILDKVLAAAADLAKRYHAELHAVGVTMSAPGVVAHNPSEYTQKLETFAADQTAKYGVDFRATAAQAHRLS